uniref:Uncharacterized protein n=1 Tax=Strigamia maritima TaxID=126957 RepID=T1ISZ3_STRMM
MVGEHLNIVLKGSHFSSVSEKSFFPFYVFQICDWSFIAFVSYLIITNVLGVIFYILLFLVTTNILLIFKIRAYRIGHSKIDKEKVLYVVCKWLNCVATFWHGMQSKFSERPVNGTYRSRPVNRTQTLRPSSNATTIVGIPLSFNHAQPPSEVAEKTAYHLREIIAKHQHLPCSRLLALLQRLSYFNLKPNQKHIIINT